MKWWKFLSEFFFGKPKEDAEAKDSQKSVSATDAGRAEGMSGDAKSAPEKEKEEKNEDVSEAIATVFGGE